MSDNHNFIEHVYVVNPGQIGKDLPSIIAVSITNPCISICEPIDVNVIGGTISVGTISVGGISIISSVPLDVNILNPCISICEPISVSVINPVINPVNVNIVGGGGGASGIGGLDVGGVQQWDADFVDGNTPLLWDTSIASGATATDVLFEAARLLTVNTTAGSTAIIQCRQRQIYSLGRSKRIIVGALFGAKKTNVTKHAGFFDSENGMFFEQTGTTLSVVTRTNASGVPVDTAVPQASWNVDPLDGTGPSGITLDETKINLWLIDYDYHGTGKVSFGFRIGGNVVYVHSMDFANTIILPFIARCTLPIRAEITNTAITGSSTNLKVYSGSVMNFSGSFDTLHLDRTIDLGTGGKVITTTLTPLISVRLKSAFNKMLIKVNKINLFVASGAVIRWVLIFNPATLTAPVWTSIDADSIGEFDVSATGVTVGTQVISGYLDNNNGVNETGDFKGLYLLSSNIAGTVDTMTLAAQRSAGSTTVYASLGIEEFKR